MRDGEVADVDGLAEPCATLYRDNKGLDKRVRVGVANQKIVVRVVDLPLPRGRQGARRPPSASTRRTSFRCRSTRPSSTTSRSTSSPTRPAAASASCSSPRAARWSSASSPPLRAAGLKPEGIDLSAFAMVRALHRAGPEDEHVLYLAIGGLTNLAVARGTACTFARASGGGVEALAVELAERSALTLEHAHGWLAHVGVEAPVEDDRGRRRDRREHARQRPARRRAPHRRRGAQLARLPPHARRGRAASRAPSSPAPPTAIPGFAAALASELGMPVEHGIVDGAPAGVDAGRVTIAAGLAVEEAPA